MTSKRIFFSPIKDNIKKIKYDENKGDIDNEIYTNVMKDSVSLNFDQIENKLRETIPIDYHNCGVVYGINIKINGCYYFKIGKTDSLFSYTNLITGKKQNGRLHSLIYNIRSKMKCSVKVDKVSFLIKEKYSSKGRLGISDIESYLISATKKYTIYPEDKLGNKFSKFKEFREFYEKDKIISLVEDFTKKYELDYFSYQY